MKHLKTIQTIVNVVKIIANVIFVLSIIGACGCIIGLVALGFFGNSEFMESISISSSVFGAISGLIWCIAESIVAYMTMNYCKGELEAGTPFTYDQSKEIFRLGLFAIIVPFAASIIEAAAFGITALIDPQIIEAGSEISSSLGIEFGLTLLFISVLCKHGAELAEKLQQATANTQNEAPAEETKEQAEETQN